MPINPTPATPSLQAQSIADAIALLLLGRSGMGINAHDAQKMAELTTFNGPIARALAAPQEDPRQAVASEVDASLRHCLSSCLERMDRARRILTDDKPRPACNWGMLDTSDIRANLAAIASPPLAQAQPMPQAEPRSQQWRGDWSVFNSGGACVIEGVSFETAADYMSSDRFTRGWTMVACKVIQSPEELAAQALPAAAPIADLMADALAVGDGTLHGAIDYWQNRALSAEAARDVDETNKVLADNYLTLTAAAPVAGEAVHDASFYLDEEMSGLLRQQIGDDGEPYAIKLQIGNGHSGHGLYVSLADYPEEGAIQLAASDPISTAPAQVKQAAAVAPAQAAVGAASEITERVSILRLAAEAMKCPGVAEDLIEGFTMHTEADDIIAIWRAAQAQPPSEADRSREGGDDRPEWYGVQDEVTLTRAVHVMNDVLGDISEWEDKALFEAVKDSKIDLMAMVECIRMNADDSYVPGSKPIDGETFGSTGTTSSEGAN